MLPARPPKLCIKAPPTPGRTNIIPICPTTPSLPINLPNFLTVFLTALPIFLNTFFIPLNILLKNPIVRPYPIIPLINENKSSIESELFSPLAPTSLAKAVAYKVVFLCWSLS